MKASPFLTVLLLTTAALSCMPNRALAAEDQGWDWIVAPYGWGASIGTDLKTTQPPDGSVSTDTEFDDVVDKLDGAFEIHVEGQGDRFGVFADFTYLGLGDSKEYQRFSTTSDLDTRLFEVAAVWNPSAERYKGLDLFAGLRYIDIDLGVQLDPVNPLFATSVVDEGRSFSDLMVGARYTWSLSDRWGLTVRGDGSFGETEGTWNASAMANFRMKRGAWFVGYRYLSVEVEGSQQKTEITMSGPQIGYGFFF